MTNAASNPVPGTSCHDGTLPPESVSFGQALVYWLKLGCISFGGPAGQISMMHEELVERRRWIGERRFLHALNYTMVLPGPEAQQLATYIGWLLHGVWGGIAAGFLFVAPSLLVLIGLSWVYLAYGDVPAVAGALYGIKPAVTAIVLLAAVRIGTRALRNRILWTIAGAAFIAIFAFDLPFPLIIIGAAVAGAFGSRLAPAAFSVANAGHEAGDSRVTALIDDHAPLPAHTRHSTPRMMVILAIGVGLGIGGFVALGAAFGPGNALSDMALFFTKAAFLTFGGAYAVLPYVYQGGVETFGWLSATQMIDGLALGESTPGPLIMVVAFVGYVGAWNHAVMGPDALALAGVAGACVATAFTFLPSFLFILIGAPLVEATRDNLRLTGPLTAITAAVVGVILNLALFFAWHVLWPGGIDGRFEWPACVIGIVALTAMHRLKVGVMSTLVASAFAGLAWSLVGA